MAQLGFREGESSRTVLQRFARASETGFCDIDPFLSPRVFINRVRAHNSHSGRVKDCFLAMGQNLIPDAVQKSSSGRLEVPFAASRLLADAG
jgi:hypothetical protein